MTKAESALYYASQGVHVIPLHFIKNRHCSCSAEPGKCKPGKHPYGFLAPKGLKNATTDPETIKRWWSHEPRCNVGVRTGAVSGIFVLDVDDRDNGSESLRRLEERYGPLPSTLTQITGGGRHLFFNLAQGVSIPNSQGFIGKGIDIRGEGGYVVAAPSEHQNGSVYRFTSDAGFDRKLILDPPGWLVDLCQKERGNPPKLPSIEGTLVPGGPIIIRDGEGRESYMLRTAGELRYKGIPQKQIEEILLALNQSKIDPPLDAKIVLDKAGRYDKPWPTPGELGDELLPVDAFNRQLLPVAFHEWVSDTAERMQAPIDFMAVSVMVAAGSVVGNKIAIQPKKTDIGWAESPNLWGAINGAPSVMKTGVMEAGTAPVKALQIKAAEEYEREGPTRQFELAKYEAQKKEFEQKLKKGMANQTDMPFEPKFEPQRRYVVNDTTFQKLGEILKDNPHGVLVYQDELSGLLESLSAQGQEGARGFYLTAWNGRQSYTFDRIGRGTTLIKRVCISVLGAFQPDKLRQHLGAAVIGGKNNDGMTQRFQLLVYPDISDTWKYVDRLPQYDFVKIQEVFERLDQIDPLAIGAQCEFNQEVPVLKFDDEAQELFIKMLTKLENRLRSGGLDPALVSHLAKYRKLIPALALLIHLIDVGRGPVGAVALKKAWGWAKYLESHARRVYAVATGIKDQATRSLMRLIESGDLKDGFTAREVYRRGRSGLVRQEDTQEAIDALLELGWLRAVSDPIDSKPGRPSFRYVINPKIRRAA